MGKTKNKETVMLRYPLFSHKWQMCDIFSIHKESVLNVKRHLWLMYSSQILVTFFKDI